MSLLEHPEAQALLADAVVTPEHVRGCQDRLTAFLQRYLPRFYRAEQRDPRHARHPRPAQRPGAQDLRADRHRGRRPPQAGPVLRRRRQVGRRGRHGRTPRPRPRGAGRPDGVLVLDPSAFPKKGTESCGVARQWCGRLGKVDNCQVGVFLAYAAPGGYAPLDRRLYLPEDWADDPARREKCHVPEEVDFQEKWRIALDLLERSLPGLPHGWIAGDDEFGRPGRVPRLAAAARRAVRAGRALQHHGPRPGAPPPPAAACRPGPQAARCRSAGPTPGRRGSRSRGGRG